MGDRPWKPSPFSCHGGAADAAERRHRHHHPHRSLRDVAAGRTRQLRLRAWRYLPDGSENPDFFLQPAALSRRADPRRRRLLRLRQLARGRGLGADGHGRALRHRALVRPDLLQQLLPERPAADPLPRADVLAIADELEAATRPGSDSEPRLGIDLQTARSPRRAGGKIEFQIDGIRRDALLKGLNEVALRSRARRDRRPSGQGARRDAVALSGGLTINTSCSSPRGGESPASPPPRGRGSAS